MDRLPCLHDQLRRDERCILVMCGGNRFNIHIDDIGQRTSIDQRDSLLDNLWSGLHIGVRHTEQDVRLFIAITEIPRDSDDVFRLDTDRYRREIERCTDILCQR